MNTIQVCDVIVDRGARTRREVSPEAIASLAESIGRIGLINPITLDSHNVLIAGETRLRAVESLGWTSVPFRRFEDLSAQDKLAIEVEENLKRTDLPWQDQADALYRFHEMNKERSPGWRDEDTALAIGLSRSQVSKYLVVAREALVSDDKEIKAIQKFSVAHGRVARKVERRASDELDSITRSEPEFASLHSPVEASPIIIANFLEWAETYDGPTFNLIHCDFPYGINADKFYQGAAQVFGGYADTPELYFNLVHTLVTHRERLLGNSGHVLFWFSMRYYQETFSLLKQHFWVDPYPCIWFKSDNKGILPDPTRGPRRVYETAFICSHGDRKILSAVANVFAGPTIRLGEHMSEKSEDMLKHFFKMFVDENTRMLDPTCGSGSALRAARDLGCTSVLGLEINPDFAEAARRAWDRTK